jgi:leucyl-tRNA synthetase
LQLAPEHPIVADLIASNPALLAKVEDLIAQQRAKEEGNIGAIEKHGVFSERYALNPFNGERCPSGWRTTFCWITARARSCRAGARRARLRVRQEIRLDIKVVILPRREGDAPDGGPNEPLPFVETNSLLINSGEYSGLAPKKRLPRCLTSPKNTALARRR